MNLKKILVFMVFLIFLFSGSLSANTCLQNNTINLLLHKINQIELNGKEVSLQRVRELNELFYNSNFSKKELLCLMTIDFGREANFFIIEKITKFGLSILDELNEIKIEVCNNEKSSSYCNARYENLVNRVIEAVEYNVVLCVDYSDCGLSVDDYSRAISFEIVKLRSENLSDKDYFVEVNLMLKNLYDYAQIKQTDVTAAGALE